MRLIPLTQGKFAKVDDADFDWLNQWKWFAQRVRNTNKFYACRATTRDANGRQKRIYMHREVLKLSGTLKVDHEDRDTLNNQRNNLRPATNSQNQQNREKKLGAASRFVGVTTGVVRCPKWRAHIRVNRKLIHLGYFSTELEAAKARDIAAEKYFGQFATLNLL